MFRKNPQDRFRPSQQQTAGDCQKSQCDGSGNIVSVADDTDVPNDANACTADLCTAGVPSNPGLIAGTPCAGGICNGGGSCVGCLTDTDCPGPNTECQARKCLNGTCGFTYTNAGTAVSAQSGGDCHQDQCNGAGAIVTVIDNTDIPIDINQCTDDICTAGIPSHPPSPADTSCTQYNGKVCDGLGSCGPYNLAGNGNAEYATTDGWTTNGGVTLALSDTAASGYSNSGQYSLVDSARTANYMGPAYKLPTGPGKYIITGWGMQNDDDAFSGALQIALQCGNATASNHYASVAYGVTMTKGVWTKFSATVDTGAAATSGTDCLLGTPGDVRAATLYLNQVTSPGSPVVFPNLYLDDIVVQVTDGHNLIGVPTFEVDGVTSGWGNNGGGTLATSIAQFHGGTRSLALTGRTGQYNGPTYSFPLGKEAYNIAFWAMHTGTSTHNLLLQTSYRCLGETSAQTHFGAPLMTASAVPGNTWTQLSASNVLMPPSSAPVGCRLVQANVYVQQEGGTCGTGSGQIEYPDLYLDDASITVAP